MGSEEDQKNKKDSLDIFSDENEDNNEQKQQNMENQAEKENENNKKSNDDNDVLENKDQIEQEEENQIKNTSTFINGINDETNKNQDENINIEQEQEQQIQQEKGDILDIDFENPQNEEEQYEVEEIVKHKVSGGRTKYFIKWKNYPHSDNTWEPKESLEQCSELLKMYEQKIEDEKKSSSFVENKPAKKRGNKFEPSYLVKQEYGQDQNQKKKELSSLDKILKVKSEIESEKIDLMEKKQNIDREDEVLGMFSDEELTNKSSINADEEQIRLEKKRQLHKLKMRQELKMKEQKIKQLEEEREKERQIMEKEKKIQIEKERIENLEKQKKLQREKENEERKRKLELERQEMKRKEKERQRIQEQKRLREIQLERKRQQEIEEQQIINSSNRIPLKKKQNKTEDNRGKDFEEELFADQIDAEEDENNNNTVNKLSSFLDGKQVIQSKITFETLTCHQIYVVAQKKKYILQEKYDKLIDQYQDMKQRAELAESDKEVWRKKITEQKSDFDGLQRKLYNTRRYASDWEKKALAKQERLDHYIKIEEDLLREKERLKKLRKKEEQDSGSEEEEGDSQNKRKKKKIQEKLEKSASQSVHNINEQQHQLLQQSMQFQQQQMFNNNMNNSNFSNNNNNGQFSNNNNFNQFPQQQQFSSNNNSSINNFGQQQQLNNNNVQFQNNNNNAMTSYNCDNNGLITKQEVFETPIPHIQNPNNPILKNFGNSNQSTPIHQQQQPVYSQQIPHQEQYIEDPLFQNSRKLAGALPVGMEDLSKVNNNVINDLKSSALFENSRKVGYDPRRPGVGYNQF